MLVHFACPLPVPPPQAGEGTLWHRPSFATMTSSHSPLVLPLAALFVAFFVAPLIVLVALSLTADTAAWTAANYVKFFTDRFNYSILWDTLFLGLKATLVCLLFGYPI